MDDWGGSPVSGNLHLVVDRICIDLHGGFQLVMGVPQTGCFGKVPSTKMDDDWEWPAFRKAPHHAGTSYWNMDDVAMASPISPRNHLADEIRC